ncbi:MAG TPA: 5'-3' exonuclease H3TH domain-containing protein, partial [Thermoanaerobaculia bacterium]
MPAARPTLYLVDAMSNIHRAYHAIRGLSTKSGRPTNAVFGFVTMLRKMLREHPSEYLAVAFDRKEKTVRHEEYDAYKANRPAMDDDLASQIPDVRRACEAYRIPVLDMPGYEADDVIGTLSRQGRDAGYDVVIVTADKDMLQLVEGSRVRVFHTGKEKFLDEKGVLEFFGVAPGQVVDVLALMGDSSDNIPGVPRVGEVTAKKWITEFGSLDGLLGRADEVKGKVGESLREHRDDALLSRRLAAIRTDLPLPFDPEQLKRSPPDAERLKELFVELEFTSLAAEIQGEQAQAALASRRLADDEPFDLANAGGRPGVALLTRDGQALLAIGDSREVAIAEGPAAAIAERWATLDRPGTRIAICDAKPLDRLLADSGRVVAADVMDIGLAQYVLSSGVGSAEFEPLVFARLGRRVTPDKEAGVVNATLPAQQAIESADRWLAERAAGAADLAPILAGELAARPALEKVYREIERPL